MFTEGDPPDDFCTVVSGRVKVFKMTPAGKDVILEIFGAGDPLGAVAAYDGNPFPASAVAIEDSLHGVIAAKAAGMRCVAVPNPLLAHEDYSAADICVPSLADATLEALLARLG